MTRTHGYARKGLVPHLPSTNPKVCRACDKWFAARVREALCDGCVPGSVRTLRAARIPIQAPSEGNHTRTPPRRGKRAGQRGVKVVFSDALGLTLRCPLSDPRSASLECRALALEAAAAERWRYGRAA